MKLAAVAALAVVALTAVGSAGASSVPPPDFVDRYAAAQSQQTPDFVTGHVQRHGGGDRSAVPHPVPPPDFVDRFVVGQSQHPLDSADRHALQLQPPDFVDRFVARTATGPAPASVSASPSTDDGSPVPAEALLGTTALLLFGLGAALHLRSRRRVLQPL